MGDAVLEAATCVWSELISRERASIESAFDAGPHSIQFH